jgi:hypothetical protein
MKLFTENTIKIIFCKCPCRLAIKKAGVGIFQHQPLCHYNILLGGWIMGGAIF